MACYKNIVYGPSANDAVPNTTLNAVIPTTGTPKLRAEAVYGDDGVQIAYYEYTLTVDTIIYEKTTVLADIETEATRLRDILLTPRLILKIYPVGLGEFPIVGPVGTAGVQQPDVSGGPFPQNVAVEPIASNNAIYVHFEMIFRIKHCPINNDSDLIQYSAELDFDIDDEGDMVFNYRLTYQTRVPITDISTLDNIARVHTQDLAFSFQGMRRRKRTSLSRDQRTAKIHLEFREIKSDNAFFYNTHNIDLTDELSSALLNTSTYGVGGFYRWKRRFQANINLPARVHKAWAWVVFLRILRERFFKLVPLTKIAAVLEANKPAANLPDKVAPWYLLLDLKLTNSVYSRTMKFECTYLTCVSIDKLWADSKIFDRVNTEYVDEDNDEETPPSPSPLSRQWRVWAGDRDISLSGQFRNKTLNLPIVYSQCEDISLDSSIDPSRPLLYSGKLMPQENDPDWPAHNTTNSATSATQSLYPARNGESPGGSTQDKEPYIHESWLQYKNTFKIKERTQSVHVSFLKQPSDPNYYKVNPSLDGIRTNPFTQGVSLHGASGPKSGGYDQQPITIARGISAFSIIMTGYALRVKYQIPIPSVISIGPFEVQRTGVINVSQEQVAVGDVPVYLAMWSIEYLIDGDILSSDIVKQMISSGLPGDYV